MSKKIGFVINSFAGGGAERIFSYVINNIDRKRFSPFLCLVLSPEQGYELATDVPVHILKHKPLPLLLRTATGVLSLLIALRYFYSPSRYADMFHHSQEVFQQMIGGCSGLKSVIDRENPEVLVVFLQTSIVIALLTLLFYRLRVPVVCSDRIFLSRELEGGRIPAFTRLMTKLLYRRINAYVAVSEGVKADVLQQFGLSVNRIKTVYNGFDRKMVLKRGSEPLSVLEEDIFRNGCVTLITVGRLMEQKGHDVLLRAFALLRQATLSRLILVGEGPKSAELSQLAEELGISKDVVFLGWTGNPFKVVAAADVFVLSSRYEGFPNVILEAMALGKPVISTDCPSGPSEILDGGRYGLLVPPDDHIELANALLRVCSNETLRNNLGLLSRERSEYFSFERMIASFEAIIDNVLSERPKKGEM